MGWDLERFDVSVAFFQGDFLKDHKTEAGEDRVASMIPPKDAWDFLPKELLSGLAPGPDTWGSYVWDLLKSVYGLKDAPLLWI